MDIIEVLEGGRCNWHSGLVLELVLQLSVGRLEESEQVGSAQQLAQPPQLYIKIE